VSSRQIPRFGGEAAIGKYVEASIPTERIRSRTTFTHTTSFSVFKPQRKSRNYLRKGKFKEGNQRED
jgi:hypothetical protein